MNPREWFREVCIRVVTRSDADLRVGMNIRWDHFVSQFDGSRYIPGSEARDNRHIQFVREFASVVSVLQVRDFRT